MATKTDLVMYYHRAAFPPVPTKFISAINKGNFSTWLGLTAELISKHLPKSLATTKGHNKLAKQNVRSTRPQEPPVARTKTVQITVVEPSGLLATDLTGRFPTISSRGYNYIIVCYIFDANGIIVRPMRNRSIAEHIRFYNEIFGYFEKQGQRPGVHKMDNECPQELKKIIVHQNKNRLELVPPHDHRTNPA